MTYQHYKNSKKYKVKQHGKMQIEDVWYDCVIYEGLECGGTYVREKEDFYNKFKEV